MHAKLHSASAASLQVNPDDVVQQFGADSLRLYEMFMGPLRDTKVGHATPERSCSQPCLVMLASHSFLLQHMPYNTCNWVVVCCFPMPFLLLTYLTHGQPSLPGLCLTEPACALWHLPRCGAHAGWRASTASWHVCGAPLRAAFQTRRLRGSSFVPFIRASRRWAGSVGWSSMCQVVSQ